MNMRQNLWRWLLAAAVLAIVLFFGWRYATALDRRVLIIEPETGRISHQSISIPRAAYYNPTASHGRIYVADGKTNQLLALSAGTGRELWRYTPDPEAVQRSQDPNSLYPVQATAEGVAVPVGLDTIAILDAQTGSQQHLISDVWLMNPFTPVMRLTDQALVVVSGNATTPSLQAYNLQTGRSLWQTPIDKTKFGGCLPDFVKIISMQSKIYLAACDGLYAYDGQTGRLLTEQPEFGLRYTTGENALHRVANKELITYESDGLTPKWSYTLHKSAYALNLTTPTADTVVLVSSRRNERQITQWRTGFHASSGTVIWEEPIANPFEAIYEFSEVPLTAIDGHVYYLLRSPNDGAEIQSIAAENGQLIWRYTFEEYNSYWGFMSDGRFLYLMTEAPRWRYWF